jgi:hypothetical protein
VLDHQEADGVVTVEQASVKEKKGYSDRRRNQGQRDWGKPGPSRSNSEMDSFLPSSDDESED